MIEGVITQALLALYHFLFLLLISVFDALVGTNTRHESATPLNDQMIHEIEVFQPQAWILYSHASRTKNSIILRIGR